MSKGAWRGAGARATLVCPRLGARQHFDAGVKIVQVSNSDTLLSPSGDTEQDIMHPAYVFTSTLSYLAH